METYGSVGQVTYDNIIQHIGFACWITKATDTHSEYVILIASPRQQWLHEWASMLLYMYIAYKFRRHKISCKYDLQAQFPGLLCYVNVEDGGTMLHQNVGNYLPADAA